MEERETTQTEPTIKDSGSRREFDTGAVRDIQEGKGRCDLLPLDVVAGIMGDHEDPDAVLYAIARFMETGKTYALYEAVEYFRNACGVETESMVLELAKHFENGAKKYGEHNWQKGIPVHCYIDSAVRHYLKWLRGDKDEPHDRAFVWNIVCCIWTVHNKPELCDISPKEPSKETGTTQNSMHGCHDCGWKKEDCECPNAGYCVVSSDSHGKQNSNPSHWIPGFQEEKTE